MRELELFRQYLVKERDKHLTQAHRLAIASESSADYVRIVSEHDAAEIITTLLVDLRALDQDTGEFIKRFLS